jgi:CTP:molybdopterin cytidylyltransferase MocA
MPDLISKIPLVILAGGKSSRMGTPKGLLELNGRTWVHHQLETFRSFGGKEAVVVVGYNADAYLHALSTDQPDINVTVNSKPENGPFSSLLEGLCFFKKKDMISSGAFVLPVDVPCPGKGVWDALSESAILPVSACYPVFENKGGHPVWISEKLILKCLDHPPTDRLDYILQALPSGKICRVDVADSRVIINVNDRDAWENYKKSFE